MEPKKNSNADLNRRRIIFLQIGLILVLLLAYLGLEWKTYAEVKDSKGQITYAEPEEEVIPITTPPQATPPPPPPPKIIVDEINQIDDDEPDQVEDNTESTEDVKEIVDVADIVEAPDDEEPAKVSFEFIEDVPIFPGCEALDNNNERKACMSEKIKQYINREFDKSLGGQLGLSGITRVNVMFTISKEGKIIDIQTRAPHPDLEEEARRVLESLPKMQPGKQRGKPVNVSYALPIIFKVN